MKQTAVEWLIEHLISQPYSEQDFEHNFQCWEKAKEMEKEQIMDAWVDGTETKWDSNKYAEQYYKQTFKSE